MGHVPSRHTLGNMTLPLLPQRGVWGFPIPSPLDSGLAPSSLRPTECGEIGCQPWNFRRLYMLPMVRDMAQAPSLLAKSQTRD